MSQENPLPKPACRESDIWARPREDEATRTRKLVLTPFLALSDQNK